MKTSLQLAALAALLLLCMPSQTRAASPTPSANSDAALRQQITELQAKVKKLEAASSPHAMPSASPSMSGMGSSPSGSPMNMRMGEMNMGSMQNKPMQGGMMGMGMMSMMGEMKMGTMPSGSPGMNGMSAMPQSALPGFPGVSHLYHIGSTGFFLDHAEHISLTPDQRTALNQINEQALGAKTHSEHQIERAEQELGELTSADQPDAAKIEGKVREIDKLRSDERLAFIKAVGSAASLLTDDQRKILVGAMQPSNAMPSPSASMSPMSHM